MLENLFGNVVCMDKLHIYAKIGVVITKYDMDLTNNIVISVAKLTQRYSIHDFFCQITILQGLIFWRTKSHKMTTCTQVFHILFCWLPFKFWSQLCPVSCRPKVSVYQVPHFCRVYSIQNTSNGLSCGVLEIKHSRNT
jgi:hypothetical protein